MRCLTYDNGKTAELQQTIYVSATKPDVASISEHYCSSERNQTFNSTHTFKLHCRLTQVTIELLDEIVSLSLLLVGVHGVLRLLSVSLEILSGALSQMVKKSSSPTP